MGVNDVSKTETTGKNAAIKYYNEISSLATNKWKNQTSRRKNE